MLAQLKSGAKRIKRQLIIVHVASTHPLVPWYVKLLLLCVLGYALSPIDLIPDFIPVIGYLDDLILVPLGIWVALRMIPPHVLQECVEIAEERKDKLKKDSYLTAFLFVILWVTFFTYLATLLAPVLGLSFWTKE